MKIFYKLLLVILALFLEVVALQCAMVFWLDHGPPADVPYRHAERLAAFQKAIAHGPPEADAAFQAEVRLLHQHEDWKWQLPLGVLIIANAVGVYYFFRPRRQPTAAT